MFCPVVFIDSFPSTVQPVRVLEFVRIRRKPKRRRLKRLAYPVPVWAGLLPRYMMPCRPGKTRSRRQEEEI